MTTRASASAAADAASATPASRRARSHVSGCLEPETQVLLLLAERHGGWTAEITGSRRLRDAVGLLREATGATPAQLMAMLDGPEPGPRESVIDVLVSRCWAFAADAAAPAGDEPAVGGSSGLPVEHRPASAAPRRTLPQHSRWQPDHLVVAGLGTAGRRTTPESEREQLLARIRAAMPYHRTVAVVSAAGGAGATTITTMLGHVLVDHRRDRVVALDVSPNPGPLVARSPGLHSVTVPSLLDREADVLRRAQAATAHAHVPGLDLVTADGDPGATLAPAADEQRAAALLARLYPVVLADGGSGRLASGERTAIAAAHQIVVAVAPTIAGVQAGGLLLDWLERRGLGRLAADGVVVLNAVPEHTPVHVTGAMRYFAERVRAVRVVPWDDYLALGADLAPQAVGARAGRAYLEVAADVVDGLAVGAGPTSGW